MSLRRARKASFVSGNAFAGAPMSEIIARFAALPAHALAALVVLLSYAIQSEVRFGARARTARAGAADRQSTRLLSLATAVSVLGFALAMKANSPDLAWLPQGFRASILPGMPVFAWIGVAAGVLGFGLRLWAVLTLRERYTRTLLVQQQHAVESRGPYRWVRHPGYLGSLLCLNGFALASGNYLVFVASLLATGAAYRYRIKVEEDMLAARFGVEYIEYQRRVGALIPSLGNRRER